MAAQTRPARKTPKPALQTSGAAMKPDLKAREQKRATAKPTPADKKPRTRKPDAARAKLAARVVKLRDADGLAWKVIQTKTKQNPAQLRRLYNLGRKSQGA